MYTTLIITALTLALTASAWAFTLPTGISAASAQRVVRATGTLDLQGIRLTCSPGKRVGLWVESVTSQPITVKNAHISGCEVGVLAKSSAQSPMSLQDFTVVATKVGIWLKGSPGGMVSGNTVSVNAGGAEYYVSGMYALSNNQ